MLMLRIDRHDRNGVAATVSGIRNTSRSAEVACTPSGKHSTRDGCLLFWSSILIARESNMAWLRHIP